MIEMKNISYHQASVWHVKGVTKFLRNVKKDDRIFGEFEVLKKLPILETKINLFRQDNKNEVIEIGSKILIEKIKRK